MAASRDIGIAPGPIFSAHRRYENYIRLNCSHPWSDSLDKTLKWLGQTVSQMSGQKGWPLTGPSWHRARPDKAPGDQS